MRIGVVGLGLIGGSVAKAFSERSQHTVLGYDADASVNGFACLSGMVSGTLDDAALGQCDLLILATYPFAAERYLREAAPKLKKGAVVLDCLGIKQHICQLGFSLAKQYGFTFVGGHPMAGSQHAGIKYARADLFDGAPMVIVPPDGNNIELLEWVKDVLKPLGFGRITVTTAQWHDRMIGYTSQLTHLISNAYVQSPSADALQGYTGGSFRDMTRVAYLNPALWAELFLENKENLLDELDQLIGSLTKYRTALQQDDAQTLEQLLEAGSRRKKEMDS